MAKHWGRRSRYENAPKIKIEATRTVKYRAATGVGLKLISLQVATLVATVAILATACGGAGQEVIVSADTADQVPSTPLSSTPSTPVGETTVPRDDTKPQDSASVDVSSVLALFPTGTQPEGPVMDLFELIHGTTAERIELSRRRYAAFQQEIGACLAEKGFAWNPLSPSLTVLTADLEGSIPAFDRVYPDGFGIVDQSAAAAASSPVLADPTAGVSDDDLTELTAVLGVPPDSYVLTVFQPGNYSGSTLGDVTKAWPRPADGFNCLERGWQAGEKLDTDARATIEQMDSALSQSAEMQPEVFIDQQTDYLRCMADAGFTPGEYGDRYSMLDPVREILAMGTGNGGAEKARRLESEIAAADARCWGEGLKQNAAGLRRFRDDFVSQYQADLDHLAQFWSEYSS